MKGLQEECGPNQKTIGAMGEASLTDGTLFLKPSVVPWMSPKKRYQTYSIWLLGNDPNRTGEKTLDHQKFS